MGPCVFSQSDWPNEIHSFGKNQEVQGKSGKFNAGRT